MMDDSQSTAWVLGEVSVRPYPAETLKIGCRHHETSGSELTLHDKTLRARLAFGEEAFSNLCGTHSEMQRSAVVHTASMRSAPSGAPPESMYSRLDKSYLSTTWHQL